MAPTRWSPPPVPRPRPTGTPAPPRTSSSTRICPAPAPSTTSTAAPTGTACLRLRPLRRLHHHRIHRLRRRHQPLPHRRRHPDCQPGGEMAALGCGNLVLALIFAFLVGFQWASCCPSICSDTGKIVSVTTGPSRQASPACQSQSHRLSDSPGYHGRAYRRVPVGLREPRSSPLARRWSSPASPAAHQLWAGCGPLHKQPTTTIVRWSRGVIGQCGLGGLKAIRCPAEVSMVEAVGGGRFSSLLSSSAWRFSRLSAGRGDGCSGLSAISSSP
jgi:hypothetical protein